MEILNCPLCNCPTLETKCLLFSVKKKLKSVLNDYVPDFNEQDSKESKNQQSFTNMLKIMFGDKYFENLSIAKCNHQKICRYLKRKFKCDSKTFQQICQHLSLKIAQTNFHFQVLTSQLKTLTETVPKVFFEQLDNTKKLPRTFETIQPEDKVKGAGQNSIEKNEIQLYNYGLGNQQQFQHINLQYQYFHPFGYYYTLPPFNPNPQNRKKQS